MREDVSDDNGVVCMRGRALAEAAATVRGAENFTLKSKGKKKSKKAKFKSLAEGSLMSDTEDNSVGEDYPVEGGGDPSYRDEQSELMALPHRSPSQRKRKAPRLLEEETAAEKHSKKWKKDQSGREKGTGGEKVGPETGDAMVWGGESRVESWQGMWEVGECGVGMQGLGRCSVVGVGDVCALGCSMCGARRVSVMSHGSGADWRGKRWVGVGQGKGRSRTFEDSLFRTIFGISSDQKSSGGGRKEGGGVAGGPSSSGGHGGAASSGKEKGGKLSLSGTAAKKGALVMLEKERKKDSLRSQEQLPPASAWTHGEDAVLCAVVHEYGGNWQLASDALGGGPDGGVYRGRHRHPIHCRERFRQLLVQNAAAASGDPTSEKSAVSAATNAPLRVTEVGGVGLGRWGEWGMCDGGGERGGAWAVWEWLTWCLRWVSQEHTKRLLDAVLLLPEQELLVQRHFVALLAAVQNSGKAGPQHGSEEAGGGAGANPPCGPSFVSLKSLVKGSGVASKSGAGKWSAREVSAALAQAERESKGAGKAGSVKAGAKERVPKEVGGGVEDEGFSVAQFLVGAESGAGECGRAWQAQGARAAATVEEVLGYSPAAGPPRVSAEAVRHLAEVLVLNRFRSDIFPPVRLVVCMLTMSWESSAKVRAVVVERMWTCARERRVWHGSQ